MQEISELAIREGCFNPQLSCPDPILWLMACVIIGIWIASCIWVAYIKGLEEKLEEKEGDE